MSLEKFKKSLSEKKFQRFYLLFGEERYLIRHYKKQLLSTALSEESGMNFTSFSEKNPNIDEILGSAMTLPFFSDYRVILLENTDLFSSQNTLNERLQEIPSSTIMLFVEENVDKRTKLYKAISKEGLVVEFKRESSEELIKWILSFFKKNTISLSRETAAHLLTRVGNNMDLLFQEMEKIISFSLGKTEIGKKEIDEICPETIQDHVFKMIESIGKKDRETALSLYFDLLDLREPMIKILSLIIRHFHLLLQIKKLEKEGRLQEAASLLQLPSFAVNGYLSQAKNFTLPVLEKAMEDAVTLDFQIKTGGVNEKIAVEQFLIKYTSQKRKA